MREREREGEREGGGRERERIREREREKEREGGIGSNLRYHPGTVYWHLANQSSALTAVGRRLSG